MFDIGWSELMLIGVVALIVIGPKELPAVLRTVGRTVGKVRRMANEFQGQFQDALREADIADMRKEISDITEKARSTVGSLEFDPLESVRAEIQKNLEDMKKPLGEPTEPPAEPAASAAPEAPAALGAPVGTPDAGFPLPPPSDEPLPELSFDEPARAPDPVPAAPSADVPEPKKSAS